AGTPALAEIYALGELCQKWDWEGVYQRTKELSLYLAEVMKSLVHIRNYAVPQSNLVAFSCPGINDFDLQDQLAKAGFALRGGQHCAQPLFNFWQIPSLLRLSLGVYNTEEEIDQWRNFFLQK
nr:aminotransferase class V-fold PLP-dependent enzyme [Candidatus Gracilibacteria bacterium]